MILTKETALRYPTNLRDDELSLLKSFMNQNIAIEWNGENLYKRKYISLKDNKEANLRKLPAKIINDLLSKKAIYDEKDESGRHLLKINPLLSRYFENPNPIGKEFQILDKKIKVVALVNENINPYYIEKEDLKKEYPNTETKTLAKQLYLGLLSNGILNNVLLNIDKSYFIFTSKGIIKTLKKIYVKKLLELTEEVLPTFKKESNNVIIGEYKDLKTKFICPDGKGFSNNYFDSNEEFELFQDLGTILVNNYMLAEIYLKENNNIENSIKIIKRNNDVYDNFIKIQDKISKRIEKDNKERESIQHSLKQEEKLFTKPLSKIKIEADDTMGNKIVKMITYYKKNLIMNPDEKILTAYLKKEYPKTKNLDLDNYRIVELDDSIQKAINVIFISKNISAENLIVIKADNKIKSKDGGCGNMIFVFSTENKFKSQNLNSYYVFGVNGKFIDADIARNEFSYVGLYNMNNLFYRENLKEEIQKYENFTQTELSTALSILDYFKRESPKKIMKTIDRYLYFYKGKEAYAEKYSGLVKLYNSLTSMYIKIIKDEQIRASKDSESVYARSFMEKKNIKKSTQDVMENNKFIGANFKYVELDNMVDLDKFKVLEKHYEEIKGYLPNLNKKIDLRFRRLGNHRVGSSRGVAGLYYPTLKTLCVDLGATSAFVHEYGHAFDYSFFNDGVHGISDEKDFDVIAEKYTSTLKESDLDMKDIAYYTKRTEIFARSFELYMDKKINKYSDLKKNEFSENDIQYKTLLNMIPEINEYFEKIIK